MTIQKIKASESHSGLVEHFVETDLVAFTAYFDKSEKNLLFVLDKTQDSISPHIRLILDRKNSDQNWDEILSKKYKVDLEKIKPKKGHLYQPLDIEYENLNLYRNYLEDSTDSFREKRLVLNREKQALDHTIKRLDEQTDVLHKSQQTVMSSRKSVEEYTARLDRLQLRKKALEKKKKENPKSVPAEKEIRLGASLDRNHEAVKTRKKRLNHAEKRVEKSKEKIIAIKERLHQIKERLSVYKQEELAKLNETPLYKITESPLISPTLPIKTEEKTIAPPTPLSHTPRHDHPWDIVFSEHQIHIFHLLSLILIGLLVILFIVLR
ncbi:MAG: hypothetical protein ACTSXV_01025 [Alphaproteobacteria bacterium]